MIDSTLVLNRCRWTTEVLIVGQLVDNHIRHQVTVVGQQVNGDTGRREIPLFVGELDSAYVSCESYRETLVTFLVHWRQHALIHSVLRPCRSVSCFRSGEDTNLRAVGTSYDQHIPLVNMEKVQLSRTRSGLAEAQVVAIVDHRDLIALRCIDHKQIGHCVRTVRQHSNGKLVRGQPLDGDYTASRAPTWIHGTLNSPGHG